MRSQDQQGATGISDIARRPSAKQVAAGYSDDLLSKDPLLDCLVEVTRIHGNPSTRAALSAGLPIDKNGLTPTLFSRAAARAGLSSKVVKVGLGSISSKLVPAILILRANEACVLLGWEERGKSARVLFPESGQGAVAIPYKVLSRRYTGVAIFAHPHFRFDERTSDQQHEIRNRHWFWGTVLSQLPLYKDVMLGAFTVNVIAIFVPLFSMNVYDRVIPNKAMETLWVLAIGVFMGIALDYVMRLMRSYFTDMAAARIDLRLSSQIMEKVLGLRMKERPQAVGAFAAQLRSFETIRDFIASTSVTAFVDLPFSIVFISVMFILGWQLVIPALIVITFMLCYAYVVHVKMEELSATSQRASAMRNAALIEGLAALETIKTQGAEGSIQVKWEKAVAFAAGINRRTRFLLATVTTSQMQIQQILMVTNTIIGVFLISENLLSMGALIAVNMLSARAMAPMNQMVGLLMQFNSSKVALKSLNNIMAKEVERPDDANFIQRPMLSGEIEFKSVSFTYPGQLTSSLDDISFKVRPGERVVIIGRVGSGKTTLQKLLLGLYTPDDGSITIDGVDSRQLDPADIRRSIGYVPQDVVLFFGSLRENITIGAPYADESAIISATELAGLTDFVNQHPKGFDMMIGERGESLSGGQRQGVAVARAMLMDPPILMLDEPTSAMDYSSENQFKDRLRAFGSEKTILVVTHRHSLIDIGTRLIVVENGQVVADGQRDHVMQALKSGRLGRGA